MTDIVPVPAAPDVPQYPALGSAAFNQESYTYATAMPGVSYRMWQIGVATETNARAAQESALLAQQFAQTATSESDAAMGYRNQAAQSAATASEAATQATASRDVVQALYLGAHATPPASSGSGSPLVLGCWYTNMSNGSWYWWDGAAWQLGVGDIGSGFMSAIAGSFDGTAAMSGAAVQSHNLYAAAAGAHGPDWPSLAGQAVVWMVGTFGDANNAVQAAQLASASGVRFERSKSGGVWGSWSRVITDTAFVEKLVSSAVVGGSGVSHTVNPALGSIHSIALTVGAMTLNFTAPRQLGDQVTVRILSTGGAWPITFGANVKLPVGVMPAYSAGQALTLVFVAMRAGFWDCYYSGVHA